MENETPKPQRSKNTLLLTLRRTFLEGFKRFGSNFLITANLRAAMAMVLPLFRILMNNPKALLNLNWLSESKIEFRLDALRLGFFVGGFTGIFQIVRDLLAIWRHYRAKPKVAPKPALHQPEGSLDSGIDTFVAGSVAGVAMLAIPAEDRRNIALYAGMRAFQCWFNCLKLVGWFTGSKRKFLADYFWAHWDSLLFTVASAQVMYAYVMRPSTLPPKYWSFIVRTGPVHKKLLQGVKESCRGLPVNLESLYEYLDARGYKGPAIEATSTMMPGEAFHPNMSATTAVVQCFVRVWKLGFPMYLALSVVPTLVLHLGSIVSKPVRLLRPLVSGARSAAFLGTFVSVYYAFTLTYRRYLTNDNRFMYYVGGLVCGWSVLLEKKSRRAELAMYVLPRAVDSLYQIFLEYKWFASVPFGEVIIFGLSMGMMLHCYYHREGTVNPLISSVFKRLLDEKPNNVFSTGKQATLTRSYSSHWLDAMLLRHNS